MARTRTSLGLTGKEIFTITGIAEDISPLKELAISAVKENGEVFNFSAIARLDSQIEIEYYKNDGILQYVLRQFLHKS